MQTYPCSSGSKVFQRLISERPLVAPTQYHFVGRFDNPQVKGLISVLVLHLFRRFTAWVIFNPICFVIIRYNDKWFAFKRLQFRNKIILGENVVIPETFVTRLLQQMKQWWTWWGKKGSGWFPSFPNFNQVWSWLEKTWQTKLTENGFHEKHDHPKQPKTVFHTIAREGNQQCK